MNEYALISNVNIRKEVTIVLVVILLLVLTIICLSIVKKIKEK